ncbi:oxygenase MpaB family protein [Kineococcus sp. LSe6-4]|uniref:Oxygenase MpaB family protein n=1 Tax=Kineococcus halophytocola TaxID=3234027 RepID=A0ABV4H1B5_9ACTN
MPNAPRSRTPRVPVGALFPPAPGAGLPGDPGPCPGPQFRRVTGERVTVLGGPAAILLQIAHPLVAEGVAVHSRYADGPARRLVGTLQAALTVTFGDTEQARAAARHVGRAHAPVRGTTRTGVPGTPAGTPYRGNDPDLALWVHATLVWTARRVTERYAGLRLSPAERERHWQESKPFARVFAVPERVLPGTVAEFDEYVRDTVRGLVVTDDARRIARDILTQRTTPPLPGAAATARTVTADLLPPALADAYGIPRTPARRAAARALRTTTTAVRPVLPQRLALWPHALVAQRRTTPAAGTVRPPETGRPVA